jgi:TetR/AcrR family transcriptional regulator
MPLFDNRPPPGVLTNRLVKQQVAKSPAPASRKPAGRPADSRAALLRAAAGEFSERGYDAARVDRIAARARLNKAMLYYHFGSKRSLYVEVLRDVFTAVAARARGIADGPGTAVEKLDAWIAAIVAEAGARPWFPPVMLHEIASGAPHLDPETFGLMNAVYGAVRDIIVQGQHEKTFRAADPLLTHLSIMPPVLIFFARQRVVAKTKAATGIAAARQVDEFVRHMQISARGMLRHD